MERFVPGWRGRFGLSDTSAGAAWRRRESGDAGRHWRQNSSQSCRAATAALPRDAGREVIPGRPAGEAVRAMAGAAAARDPTLKAEIRLTSSAVCPFSAWVAAVVCSTIAAFCCVTWSI